MSGSVWDQVVHEIEAFQRDIRELPVSRATDPNARRADLAEAYPFDGPIPLDRLVSDVARRLRTGSVHVTHPRYFGLFNPSVRTAGMVGDLIAASFNPQLVVWSHAPVAQELERLVLDRFTEALEMDHDRTISHFTTGGAEANLTAVLAALARAYPEADRRGLAEVGARPTIYLTEESHHSFVKIARMCGLGTDVLRPVGITSGFAMDVADLADRIAADRGVGAQPLMIVATAGTTGTGAVDPLDAVAEVARDAGTSMQRGVALRCSRPGFEPYSPASGVRIRSRGTRTNGSPCRWAPACSSAGTATPCDAPSASRHRTCRGRPKMSRTRTERRCSGHGAPSASRSFGWVVVNDTPLPVICFTRPEVQRGDVTTDEILATLNERGRVWISQVTPTGAPPVLRACITSYRTDESDLGCLVEDLEIRGATGGERPSPRRARFARRSWGERPFGPGDSTYSSALSLNLLRRCPGSSSPG
jgi:aromatic-L-amino-acid/L-tryptophan decarboxylase